MRGPDSDRPGAWRGDRQTSGRADRTRDVHDGLGEHRAGSNQGEGHQKGLRRGSGPWARRRTSEAAGLWPVGGFLGRAGIVAFPVLILQMGELRLRKAKQAASSRPTNRRQGIRDWNPVLLLQSCKSHLPRPPRKTLGARGSHGKVRATGSCRTFERLHLRLAGSPWGRAESGYEGSSMG